MSISFAGRVAIVTGAGGGLGRTHALDLAKRGARVLVNDLGGGMDGSGGSLAAAEAVVEEIRALGGEALADGHSVSDPDAAASMVKTALDAWGKVDVLINNAGILRDKSFIKMANEDFQAVTDVHLMGSFYCTKAVWSLMRDQGYGRIIMTSSPSGLFGNFGQTNYGAAKLGLVGFMNTLVLEGAKYNVRTNAIAPVAATRMTEDIIPAEVLGNLGPELVTAGVVYLCSEDAPNGAILQAAGGKFWLAAIVENKGVNLGTSATADDVAEHFGAIADLTKVKPRRSFKS